MSNINHTVLDSNKAAGTRLELLLFKLSGSQTFGINVFKVQEIIPYQHLTRLPQAHGHVRGIANLRGQTISVIDLSAAIGKPSIADTQQSQIIITEYNRSVHGFLTSSVDRIEHVNWDQVQATPNGSSKNSYVTSVVLINGVMVGILDVEKVLDEIVHTSTSVSPEVASHALQETKRVLVVDDSSVARKQIQKSLEQIGVECQTVDNALSALALIDDLHNQGIKVNEHFDMMISDIEMPGMDGYQLTTKLRSQADTQDLYILLHSSISGEFNIDMVNQTGANRFIQKYDPDDLAKAVLEITAAH